jgi:hypothetical protein
MRESWWNEYIGLPYAEQGRSRDGLDCWGLVRLAYAQEFGIQLPSLVGDYNPASSDSMADLLALQREGWVRVAVPQSGDVVVCRIEGSEHHVGIITRPGFFLHVREGQASVIERTDALAWKRRITGYWRYAPQGSVIPVTAMPHPLKSRRVDGTVPAGLCLAEIESHVRQSAGVNPDLPGRATFMVDGVPVPPAQWSSFIPAPGARVEYRAVPTGGNTGRLVAAIAIAYAAWYAAPALAGATTAGGGAAFGAAGYTALGGATLGTAIASAGVNIAGTLLLNRIFPVRPPEASDPGMAASLPTLRGGSNNATPYGAVPVILGRVRFTPPLGANAYLETDGTDQFLRMLLVWGYGPLQISDLRIGDTPLSTFDDIEIETLAGRGDTQDKRDRFNQLYGTDVVQVAPGVTLENPDGSTVNWSSHVVASEVDSLSVAIQFPQGLRAITAAGSNAGSVTATSFVGTIQYRALDPDTLAPTGDWTSLTGVINGSNAVLSPVWYTIPYDSDTATGGNTVPYYQWTRIGTDTWGKIVVITGAVTQDPDAEPTGAIRVSQGEDNYPSLQFLPRMPSFKSGITPLYDICVFGDTIFDTVDNRTGITGCDLTFDDLVAEIASGTRVDTDAINIGSEDSGLYIRRKDPFIYTIKWNVPVGFYEVRARRINTSAVDFTYPSGNPGQRLHAGVLSYITGYRAQRPVRFAESLAMTALRIKITNQFDGNLQGISGTAQAICKDWDADSSTWVTRATRNPASLFRYVLQHPANARRYADSSINLTALADWHEYCEANGWMYDSELTSQRSLEDVLDDIAASGRASKTRTDGLWSVVIDRPREEYSQYITPHNSWGFSGTRSYPILPHAFRVQFNNSERGYQPDEMLVYADGYDESTATVIEGLSLPGVTVPTLIFKHTRFHLAQLILRPEVYTVNMDIEHLACTRGDLVKVVHFVPRWGLGSGRIKTRIDGTHLVLDEPVPMAASTQYSIRIRAMDGTSVVRTVAAKDTDGDYTELELTASVTEDEGESGCLFLFGTLSEESVDALVLGIEPMDKLCARITLMDYAPAVYDSDTQPIPPFDSQITLAPALLRYGVTVSPTITGFISNESVMTLLSQGTYAYALRVSYTNPATLPDKVDRLEAQIDFDGGVSWQNVLIVPAKQGAITFGDVQEGETYRVRLRYLTSDGRTGPWTAEQTHVVQGKTNPPSTVGTVTATVDGVQVRLSWPANDEIDVLEYEVRTADDAWGTPGFVFKGAATTCLVTPPAAGASSTWYVKARDVGLLDSVAASSVTFTAAAVQEPSGISHSFFDTATTTATITLDWNDAAPEFGLASYRVSYDSTVKTVKASTITLKAGWTGSREFTIQTLDQRGNLSVGTVYAVSKLAPASPVGFSGYAVDNTAVLSWMPPTVTTLPISHYLLYEGASFVEANARRIDKAGDTVPERTAGTYTYWLASVDTDGFVSTAISTQITVFAPPDYILAASYTLDWSGTLSNAIVEAGELILPVNTSETFEDHFIDNSWTTPQDQIDAGFPIFIQPGALSGYYEQDFDYGATLSSMQVSALVNLITLDGTPTAAVTLTVALDSGFSSGVQTVEGSSGFFSNFRYVRVRVTVTAPDGEGLAKISAGGATVTLDAKLRTEQGVASMTLGGAWAQRSESYPSAAAWVAGALPSSTSVPFPDYYRSGDSVHQSIVSDAGPSGEDEPTWVFSPTTGSANTDIGPRGICSGLPAMADGMLVGGIFKKNDSTGSYNIRASGAGVMTLAGAAADSLVGATSLPNTTDWFLVAIYVHPNGYAGADLGISGIYDMAGVKQTDASEYQMPSAGTLTGTGFIGWRWRNGSDGDGAERMRMVRPVIVPCTSAQAPGVIQYLIRCATEYGAAVQLADDVVDVASIALTPYGSEPTTPVADFNDVANPTHFNILNFDGATLVGGDVGYIVRRY